MEINQAYKHYLILVLNFIKELISQNIILNQVAYVKNF